MIISNNWLRELTSTQLTPEEIRERLTNVGLAVDAVEARRDDFVLDVEVPSNRGDCLSHVGIARELAAIEKSKVQSPQFRVSNADRKASDFASVEIRDADLCPRYAARVVRGVKIASSPEWLTQKLEVIGQRPINNVADITNYVLHELGQPLHAFDLAKLADRRIIVRRAERGEIIRTLDDVERKLDAEMLVIADARAAVAVAGVMGGADSEISDVTTDVLIESAYFDPASVRRTAKLLGLHTEASHRFERGTDPEGVLRAQERCVSLICEVAGGVATEDALDIYPNRLGSKRVMLRAERIEAITSLKVARSEILRILTSLGLERQGQREAPKLNFSIPSWRHDVSIEEDLVEEVARHTGYDNMQTALPPASHAGEYHSSERQKRAIRRSLAALGFSEAINFSFIESTTEFELIPEFARERDDVTLVNPIIEEASRMRSTLLPGLLTSVRNNLNHGNCDGCRFELGRVFSSFDHRELPCEREAIALVATGGVLNANRADADREIDLYDIKGAVESAVEAMNLPPLTFEVVSIKHLRPGQTAAISVNEDRVGSLGRLSESIAGLYKFPKPVFVAELDLTALLELNDRPVLYSPLPRFPSINRDVSLLVDRKLTLGDLMQTIEAQNVPYFTSCKLVGTYEGEGIPESKRSITVRLEYRAEDRTLRDEEVDRVHWSLIETLKKQFNAEVR